MKQTSLLRALSAYLFLITLINMATVHLSSCPAAAEEIPVPFYDSSKYDPLPIPQNLPAFVVIDQRSSNEIFIGMKRDMVPEKYLYNAIKQSIDQSSAKVVDTSSEIQFIIKEFVVELVGTSQRRKTGRITSTIEIDVQINTNENSERICNYKSSYYNDVDNLQFGVETSDVRNTLNKNTYNILKKIFTDKVFVDTINRRN